MTVEQIESEALSLTPEKRAALAEKLILSLENDSSAEQFTEAWVAEAERRDEQLRSGDVDVVAAGEVFRRVRARLG